MLSCLKDMELNFYEGNVGRIAVCLNHAQHITLRLFSLGHKSHLYLMAASVNIYDAFGMSPTLLGYMNRR